jgi:polyisoprenoid-binding protein YceI
VDLEADNLVRFISRASIQEVEGVTDRIDGYVLLSSERLSTTFVRSETEFYFEVDLASLDTGISLRNRHMRDNYLEVRDYPYVTLEGSIASVEAAPGGGFRVEGIGRMGLHGIERVVSTPCEVAEEGEGYRARCAFQVLLSDYGIKIPRVMFLKLANEIQIELDFHLKPASTG